MPPFAPPPEVARKVEELVYATVENAPRYRVLLRYFFEQYERQRDWLPLREVFAAVQPLFGADYTDTQCAADLDFLVRKGNLAAEQDRRRAKTVAEFRNRQLVYHLTPITVRFEATLRELEQAIGQRGSLDPTLLDQLWNRLTALRQTLEDELPTTPATDVVATRVRRPWLDAVNYFRQIHDNANAYHHALREARPTDLAEVEAFLAYKDVLLDNLEGFIDQLMDYADRIRRVLAGWSVLGVPDHLAELLAQFEHTALPDPTGRTALDERRALHRGEYEAMEQWFRPGGGCDILRHTTASAILEIAKHNQRLVDRRRVGQSRRHDLVRLGRALTYCTTLDDAHRLVVRALGVATARHLIGSAQDYTMGDAASAWQQPCLDIPLRKARRGRPARAGAAAIRNTAAAQQQLMARERERLARERAAWDAIFADGILDLAALTLEETRMRSPLLDVVGKCLGAPDHRAVAPDGSLIEVLVPTTDATEGAMQCPDGVFYTRPFLLLRESSARSEE